MNNFITTFYRKKIVPPTQYGMRLLAILMCTVLFQCQGPQLPPGDPDNGGLFLPEGFEAVVVADSLGSARHLAVNHNGDVYVKLRYASIRREDIKIVVYVSQ